MFVFCFVLYLVFCFELSTVGIDGRVARLESLEPKIIGASEMLVDSIDEANVKEVNDGSKRRKLDDTTEETSVNLTHSDWAAIQTEMETFVGMDKASEVIHFLQQSTDTEMSSPYFVRLDIIAEKETRRQLHHWIHQRLSFIAAADTEAGGCIRIWHRRHKAHMPNHLDHQRPDQRKTVKPKHPKDKPYIQFVLYKENMDTSVAMQQISKRLSFGQNHHTRGGGRGNNQKRNSPTVRMGYAGNKDKRGITSQFITIAARDCSVSHLCNVFNKDAITVVSGGGHMGSGGAGGILRVGNFEYTKDELRLGRLVGNRFDVVLRNVQLNDTSDDKNSSKDIAAILHEAAASIRATGFVNHFGVQRFGKYHDTHITGMAVVKGDYKAAIETILRPKDGERDDIHKARSLWQDRFLQDESTKDGEDKAKMEQECAKTVLRTLHSLRFLHSECAVLQSLAAHPLDYKKAFSCITKTMRMMFVHALQSYLWNKVASFRLEKLGPTVVVGDLVFADPNAKSLEDLGEQEGLPKVHVVTEDDAKNGKYTVENVVLPLIGVNTLDPENECSKMFDAILAEHGITRDMIHNVKDRSFLCTGDYRKLICRPSDVDFEVLEYNDELHPLLQNDLMKLQGHTVQQMQGASSRSSDKSLYAAAVGFSLPSSSYATMFLRELMKRPTSSEYQRELNLGGSNEND